MIRPQKKPVGNAMRYFGRSKRKIGAGGMMGKSVQIGPGSVAGKMNTVKIKAGTKAGMEQNYGASFPVFSWLASR